ncbi:DUF192 domain-containing protein [Halalkalicoccus jeotgali]|uniref:DUF192 domain-containing protein n=1 Tax=Halalkalicoccus jeotgali (strain DSM 18796 / CECT 7217 / JCM 14584 / KCTC 4019 / B3) TaxID=795797 RepID=D8J940_HALJB|nr:DUF192 domain-containing protein [Halalkalicoccus jeotgali]ADJ16309.1 hypothetical protein HacjB3_14650 [Halalkalicoccus jeotgali B3]ELY37044.1 hypothetical protein C497_09883 [Halalkalicoccus jeotgali B3]
MDTRRLPLVITAFLVVAIALALAYQLGAVGLVTGSEDSATVSISDGNERLATVDAEVADTTPQRYTGLSDHDSLGSDEGMLFAFERESTRGFVMRDMAFPIDMIFVGEDGTITAVHEAPVEEDQSDLRTYRGEAKWVLEVNYGYAAEHGITEGDRVRIDY